MRRIVRILGLSGPLRRELRRHCLTQHKTARTADKRDTGRVAAGLVVLMDRRAVRRRHVSRIDDILNADWNPVDQAIGLTVIQNLGGGQSGIRIKILPSVHIRFPFLNPLEETTCHGLACRITALNGLCNFESRKFDQIHR